MWKHGEVQWSLIRQAEIVSRIDTWEAIMELVPGSSRRQTPAEGFPQGWWCQLALPQKYHTFKTVPCCTFQQSHFGHGWLEPWSILCKQHYAIYCIWKVVFIDWNFPELIWPNEKFTIHTQTPVNEGKYGQPRLSKGKKKKKLILGINRQQSVK